MNHHHQPDLLSTRLSTSRLSLPKSSSPISSISSSGTTSSSCTRTSSLKPRTFSSLHGAQRRQLFLYHEQVITALSGKDNAYSLAALRARASADAAEKAQRALEMIRRSESVLLARLKQVESRIFRSYFFPTRTSSEITDLRKRIKAVEDREIAASRHMRRLRRKAVSDAARAARLRADANLLAASKNAGRDILKHSAPVAEEGSDSDGVEEWHDRLVKVTITALDSLSAQEEARNLLLKAGQLLSEVRRCVSDTQLPKFGDSKELGQRQAYAPRATEHYKLKMAAWKAREAGKRIERAVVLNDQLPIRDMVEANEGNLLSLPNITSIAVMSVEGIRTLVETLSQSVSTVDEVLQQSIAFQEGIVAELQGDVMGSLTELEQTATSVDLGHVRDGLKRTFAF